MHIFRAVLAGVATFGVVIVQLTVPASGVVEGRETAGVTLGTTATVSAPTILSSRLLASAPGPSMGQIAAADAQIERSSRAWAARRLPVSPTPVARSQPGTETVPTLISPNAPSAVAVFRLTTLLPPTFSHNINEPSAAVAGRYVFYTGNMYAAQSADGGTTWTYLNPFADFPSFCCDQDVVYDPGRDIFIWYRQGYYDVTSGQNRIKIGVSSNGGATWCTYTFAPAGNFNPAWTNQWFDYPHLALSNDDLYFTTNMFSGDSTFLRMVLARLPLDSMATCASFRFTYWTSADGWTWTPVQGARYVMYLGDHVSTGVFRVYTQPESSNALSWVDRAIPPWMFTNRSGTCTVLGGANPCARADHRITAGWVRKWRTYGEIGFFWNVMEGGGFPKPYVNGATFYEHSKSYKSRPLLWNSGHAWHWAAAGRNDRDDLGIGVFLFGSPFYPRHYVGIDDDLNGPPPGWEVRLVRSSTRPPTADSWGDYVRIRSHGPQGVAWVGTGYTRHLIDGANTAQPHYVAFGRGRDKPGYFRFLNR